MFSSVCAYVSAQFTSHITLLLPKSGLNSFERNHNIGRRPLGPVWKLLWSLPQGLKQRVRPKQCCLGLLRHWGSQEIKVELPAKNCGKVLGEDAANLCVSKPTNVTV